MHILLVRAHPLAQSFAAAGIPASAMLLQGNEVKALVQKDFTRSDPNYLIRGPGTASKIYPFSLMNDLGCPFQC